MIERTRRGSTRSSKRQTITSSSSGNSSTRAFTSFFLLVYIHLGQTHSCGGGRERERERERLFFGIHTIATPTTCFLFGTESFLKFGNGLIPIFFGSRRTIHQEG
jgi:hypothetical protein